MPERSEIRSHPTEKRPVSPIPPVVPPAPDCASECIHTRKIFDSCQAKDCVEDLRFYPTISGQAAIDSAMSIRAGRAELLFVDIEVKPVGLGRGFFETNLHFFYRAVMELSGGTSRPSVVEGLAVFCKRSVLFGSEGAAKIFTSDQYPAILPDKSLPTAVCEAVDPIVLSTRIAEPLDGGNFYDLTLPDIPEAVLSAFDEPLAIGPGAVPGRRIYLSLGQFSIIRLERDAQLLMPVYDYCMPEKECSTEKCEDDPCEIFQQVEFPVGEFFPPFCSDGVDPVSRLRNGCKQV